MPRRELAPRPPALVASARRYSTRREERESARERATRGGEEWQHAGWSFYDMIGEYRQAPNIKGALLSRARITVTENGKPTTNPAALAALAQLFDGPSGQSEMMRLWAIHADVAGEAWIVGPSKPGEAWRVVAATKITRAGGMGPWRVEGVELQGNPIVMRVWRPHPADAAKSDAPTRAVLPVLSELLQLRKRIAAQIDSRLFGNGLLLLPSETEFPAPARYINPGDPEPLDTVSAVGGAQGLADLLYEAGQRAIANPGSAEAMLPVIGTAEGEHIDKANLLTFASELDKQAPALRKESLISLANGMEVPIEVLLGAVGSNHWNAWLADENNVKLYGEPTLAILITALTQKYLWIALEGEEGVTDPRAFAFAVDTAQMRLRPNRSKEALELNDRMILSDEATARENGFVEADLMTEEGRQIAILRKMASGSTTPEIVALAAKLLGVDLGQLQTSAEPVEARPTPSLVEHPVRELPQRRDEAASLVWASEQLVDRALSRLGNRIQGRMKGSKDYGPANRFYQTAEISPEDVDAALQGAWEPCARFDLGVPAPQLARALDVYTRSVIHSRAEPTRKGIAIALDMLMDRAIAS